MLNTVIERAKAIILKPLDTWTQIKREETTIPMLFSSYLVVIAVIPALAMIIGYSIIGMRVPMVGTVRMPIADSILAGVLSYVLSLVGIYIGGYVINYLAPNFESKPNLLNAMKLMVYASTPALLAGAFQVIPQLSILAMVGLYGVYLLYLGLPILMETPSDKTLSYIIASIVVSVVIFALVNLIVGQFIYAPVYTRIPPY